MADEWEVSLLCLISVPCSSPTMSSRSAQGLVYCMGGHTAVNATEAVGGFIFHKCPQELCGWRMHTLADADPQEFLRSAD